MESKLKIVNPNIKYRRVELIEPTNSYYLLVAAEIDHSPFPIFFNTSKKKQSLIGQAKQWCSHLEKEDGILSAVVFKTSVIPPGKGKLKANAREKFKLLNMILSF